MYFFNTKLAKDRTAIIYRLLHGFDRGVSLVIPRGQKVTAMTLSGRVIIAEFAQDTTITVLLEKPPEESTFIDQLTVALDYCDDINKGNTPEYPDIFDGGNLLQIAGIEGQENLYRTESEEETWNHSAEVDYWLTEKE